MSVSLPYNPGKRASPTLGAVPGDAGDEFVRLRLSNASSTPLANTWHVELNRIRLSGKTSLDIPLTDVSTGFNLWPDLVFPQDATEEILEALDVSQSDRFVYPYINCSRWDDLPDLVLTLAGYDIVLAEEDYAFRGYVGAEQMCFLNIQPENFFNGPVTLGVKFMRKFHMVFDIDEHELRRKFAFPRQFRHGH